MQQKYPTQGFQEKEAQPAALFLSLEKAIAFYQDSIYGVHADDDAASLVFPLTVTQCGQNMAKTVFKRLAGNDRVNLRLHCMPCMAAWSISRD